MSGKNKTRRREHGSHEAAPAPAQSLFGFSDSATPFDPKLTSLFSLSANTSSFFHAQNGDSSAPQSATHNHRVPPASSESSSPNFESGSLSQSSHSDDAGSPVPSQPPVTLVRDRAGDEDLALQPQARQKKRKRQDEGLEGRHLQKLAREEAKETEQRQAERAAKKSKRSSEPETNSGSRQDDEDDKIEASANDSDDDAVGALDEDVDEPIPEHESLSKTNDDDELLKASRTVFLANVSTAAITSKASKRTLMNHLMSIFSSSEGTDTHPQIESLRFRSTAYSNTLPKKAAFAQKDLMDATTKSTNAYVVYSTNQAAREAAKKLNGTVVLGRHLRVDEVAHPAKVDHRRCVFVGNLGFVDDESQVQTNADGETKKIKSQKGDVEEGLWQQFANAGTIESVRVVRDPKTRVGKGFAYVQFTDENSVEAALLYNDKRFPPLLPRKLRVVRAMKLRRDGTTAKSAVPSKRGSKSNTPNTANEKTLRGRVKKLLGRAGAAQVQHGSTGAGAKSSGKPNKPPESFVFEGHRASNTQGYRGLKLGGSGKKKGGKPKTRSAKRGAAWKSKDAESARK